MYIAGNEAYPPFANAGVRQALKWAIDYDGIQKNITPNTNTVNQAFEPSMMLGAVNTNPFKKDPTERRSCLRKPDIRRASVLHSIISLGTRLPISPQRFRRIWGRLA